MAGSRNKLRELVLKGLALPSIEQGDLPSAFEFVRKLRAQQDAAVLVGLVMHADGPSVLLTRRTDHLTDHAGQVSFPGGRIEPYDTDAVAAALREAEEETGLPQSAVEVLGSLSEYRTITNYRVTPVVGLVNPGFEYVLDANEVAEVFEVPLEMIRDPAKRQRRSRNFMGATVEYWAFEHDGPLIWGATAAILVELCERLERVSTITQ